MRGQVIGDLVIFLVAISVGFASMLVVGHGTPTAIALMAQPTRDVPTPTVAPAVTFTPMPTPPTATPVPPTATPTPPAPTPTASTTPTPKVQIYLVQSGDTIESIAKKFGISQKAIIQANQLDNPDRLSLGQRLRIPVQ